MKLLVIPLLFFFTSITANSFSQSCNCPVELNHVKNYIEQNYSGFKDKVNDKTKAAYLKHTKQIMAQAKDAVKPQYCVYWVNKWLVFFKDDHVSTGLNKSTPAKNKADLSEIVKQTEVLQFPESKINALKSSKTIEGIYWSKDSADRIAIVKSENGFREYAGFILQSKGENWKPGQVKIELRKSKRISKEGITYYKDHTPQNDSFVIAPDKVGDWQREGTKSNRAETLTAEKVSSRPISKQTFYIKIGTFSQGNAKNIDSLFNANKEILNHTDYLILDLRNNGGGSDFSYQPIVPYLYTNVIQVIGADVLAGEGNIAGWKPLLDMKDIPADSKTYISKIIKEMETHKNEFVKLNGDDTLVLDSVKAYPKKIAILIDKGCGSTTEEFLLLAKQSKKVTLMGATTAGVLDYANVRETPFEGIPYTLKCATSRSRRLNIGQGIDNIGIKPDHTLAENQNWIKEAQRLLETK